jgi:hypothetical protein
MVFDNPAGNYGNFTNLSVIDIIGSGESYIINWSSNTSALPAEYASFEQKFVNITASGAPSIDYIVWTWDDAESAGYDESFFRLMEYNGTWTVLNSTPDTIGNTLSASNLSNFSIFGILQLNDSTAPQVNATSPSGPISGGSFQITYAVNETYLDSCWYSIDNGTAIALANCTNISATSDYGTHNLTVFANDTSNNTGSSTTYYTLLHESHEGDGGEEEPEQNVTPALNLSADVSCNADKTGDAEITATSNSSPVVSVALNIAGIESTYYTDSSGEAIFPAMLDGNFTVSGTKEGYESAEASFEVLCNTTQPAPAGAQLPQLYISALPLCDGTASTFEITVSDENGTAVEGATVSIPGIGEFQTDSNGTAVARNINVSFFDANASKPGYSNASGTFSAKSWCLVSTANMEVAYTCGKAKDEGATVNIRVFWGSNPVTAAVGLSGTTSTGANVTTGGRSGGQGIYFRYVDNGEYTAATYLYGSNYSIDFTVSCKYGTTKKPQPREGPGITENITTGNASVTPNITSNATAGGNQTIGNETVLGGLRIDTAISDAMNVIMASRNLLLLLVAMAIIIGMGWYVYKARAKARSQGQ